MQRFWWKVGWPWGRSVLLHALPAASCLRAVCIQQFQTSCQNYLEQHYCWATCVKWKWSSVDITQPHPTKGKLRKQCLFCIFLKIKEVTALVAKHTPIPKTHSYEAPGTLSLSAQSLYWAALYESPLALFLSRVHILSCPAKDHAPFSLFLSLFYTHPAKVFSVQEPGLIEDREGWSLGQNSQCTPKMGTSHVSGSSSTRDGECRALCACSMCSRFIIQPVDNELVLSQVSNKCIKSIALLRMELPKSLIPA